MNRINREFYELKKRNRGGFIPFIVAGDPNPETTKELILELSDTPYIVARGRKGGSNIAACICNALLYSL